MNKRDELIRDKSYLRGHTRGKSYNSVNNLGIFKEPLRQNDNNFYTKSIQKFFNFFK